jgi:hypothetical protein
LTLEAELRGRELPPQPRPGGDAAAAADAGAPGGGGGAGGSKQARRRRLREEHRVVLQILRRPEFRWAERTSLGGEGE